MNVGKLLNRSLDMKYYLSQTLIIGAVSLGFYVLVLILMFTAESNDMLPVYAVLYALIMLPFFGFFVYRMVAIKRAPDRYRLLTGVAIEMRALLCAQDVSCDGDHRRGRLDLYRRDQRNFLSERHEPCLLQ